jgi:hypothetical protein
MKIFTKPAVITLIAIGVLFQAHAKETFTITDKNANKTVHIKFKDYDTIRVELPRALVSMGNITAWQFKKTNGPVTGPIKNITPNDGLDGSAGKDVFVFNITKTGFANLDFAHVLITPQKQVIDEVLIPSSTSFNIQIT